jgi:hypothetical protein
MVIIKVNKIVSNQDINDNYFCPDCQCPKMLCICPNKNRMVIDRKMVMFHQRDGKIMEQIVETLKQADLPEGRRKLTIPTENRFMLKNRIGERVVFQLVPGKPYLSIWNQGGIHQSGYFIGIKDIDGLINHLLKMKKKIFAETDLEKLPCDIFKYR